MIAPITPPFRSVISRVNPAERLAAGDVRWVAREAGNGAGYDIRSFGTDGKTRDHPESRLRSTVLVYRRGAPGWKRPMANAIRSTAVVRSDARPQTQLSSNRQKSRGGTR